MGLRIRLRPNERIVVNGCVVTNGDRRNTVTISSFGQVLRGKYILQEDEATTPIRRLYFEIQSALIDGGATKDSIGHLNRQGAQTFVSVQSENDRACLLTAMEHVHRNDLYKALMQLRPLIDGDEDKTGEDRATDTQHSYKGSHHGLTR